MKSKKLVLWSIVVGLLLVPAVYPEQMDGNLTLSGSIVVKGPLPRLSLKLYPPKNEKRAVLLGASDSAGKFRFENLSPNSYLLEAYLGTKLVYQQVVDVRNNTLITVDLRRK
jgi:hypothetical protein